MVMAIPEVFARAAALSIAALLFASGQACANDATRPPTSEQQSPAATAGETLEKQFWACDYGAATRGILGAEAQACVVNFESLKASKFGGDFEALLSWWRDNRAAQHAARSQPRGAVAGR
jgi:hypothetical protein